MIYNYYLAREDVQTASLQIDIRDDGFAGGSGLPGKESCVHQTMLAPLAKRLRYEAPSRIFHIAQRGFGAPRASFGCGTAPHGSHGGGRTRADTCKTQLKARRPHRCCTRVNHMIVRSRHERLERLFLCESGFRAASPGISQSHFSESPQAS